VDLDQNCFGASRNKLLTAILQGKNNPSYIAVEDTEIVGFAAAKVADEMAEVGPLVCHRSQPKTAIELFNAVLSRLEGMETYAYVPAYEDALWEAALQAGFQEEFRLARMFLGSATTGECIHLAESLERG
jgi:hypothetical protein